MALITLRTAFIHVPKTGGSWIRSAIQNAGLAAWESGPFSVEDHYSVDELWKAHPEYSDRLTFGFVRHPISWLKSRWAWAVITDFPRKITRHDSLWEPAAAQHWMADCWSDVFTEFLKGMLRLHPGIAFLTFQEKLSLARPLQVDFIGRYEQLQQDTVAVLTRAGEEFDLLKLKRTPKKRVGAQLVDYRCRTAISDPGLVSAILDAESRLCDMFGYCNES